MTMVEDRPIEIPVSEVAVVDRKLEEQAADAGSASTITSEVTGAINALIKERVRLMTPPALERLRQMVG